MASHHHPHGHEHEHGHRGEHGHNHGHRHAPGHVHAPESFGRAFAVGIALNVGFVAAEIVFGLTAGSMALLADAGHNVSDVLGLVVAWGGTVLARTPPSRRFTYGLRGSSILAALFNALFLLVATGAIALEAVERLGRPEAVPGGTVMAVAAAGILVNGLTAWMFARGREGDLNIRATYLHMAADAAVSAGVVLAGLAIRLTGAAWIDSVVSLLILAVIFVSTWRLLSQSVVMALAAVPEGIDLEEVEAALAAQAGVTRVHHVHVWPMSTTEVALTAHLVTPEPSDRTLLARTQTMLSHRFGISHATLQTELEEECQAAAQRCR